MEAELLARINALGIGPQGLGGTTTCLAVFVEKAPCHIASMPMAVNVQCHAQRHQYAGAVRGGEMAHVKITTPLTDAVVERLHAGDEVEISGVIYQARDAAHKRIVELIERARPLPFELAGRHLLRRPVAGQARRRDRLGRADDQRPHGCLRAVADRARPQGHDRQGPAQSGGHRRHEKHKAVYFAATGGAGALLAKRIVGNETIAWPELGAEAVARLEVKDFPVIVVNDCHGGDLYAEGRARYAQG